MKLNVVILNALRYQDKESKKEKMRIGYALCDKNAVSIQEKFKGVSELSVFLDFSEELWNAITVDTIYTPSEFVFEENLNPRNPLKKILNLKSVKLKNANIDLL